MSQIISEQNLNELLLMIDCFILSLPKKNRKDKKLLKLKKIISIVSGLPYQADYYPEICDNIEELRLHKIIGSVPELPYQANCHPEIYGNIKEPIFASHKMMGHFSKPNEFLCGELKCILTIEDIHWTGGVELPNGHPDRFLSEDSLIEIYQTKNHLCKIEPGPCILFRINDMFPYEYLDAETTEKLEKEFPFLQDMDTIRFNNFYHTMEILKKLVKFIRSRNGKQATKRKLIE